MPTTFSEGRNHRLFPKGGVLVTRRASTGESHLFPEEMTAIARASPARMREFALGRTCARDALALLEGPRTAIPMGRFRDPVWPFGYVGSITHGHGFCAAAVAKVASESGNILGIGIDGELAAPLPNELPGLVCTADECAWLRSHHLRGVPWDRLFFSAKESVFKALFPTTHRYLEFRDVGIRFDPASQSFDVSIPSLPALRPHALVGRYQIHEDIMLAAVTWLEDPSCP